MDKKIFPISKYKFDNQDLLSELTDSESQILTCNKVITYFKAGQEIFKEGTTPKGVYRVKKGKVKKITATNFGTEHIFYICKENEYLGYHAILSEEDYPDSAIALLDCEVEFIRERTALNLLILEEKFRVDNDSTSELEINRDDLASMVGTAKESLVRMLKDFKEEKLISTKGRIIFIEDLEGLVKATNYK